MHDAAHVWFVLVYLGHDRSWVMVGHGLLQYQLFPSNLRMNNFLSVSCSNSVSNRNFSIEMKLSI